VLERQPDHVRALLLRTSILERVNGSLADLLTGGSDSERIFHELEEAGACVVSLDARRSWFRYHPLLADFLLLQLRRTAPGELGKLHIAAAHWYADHDCPVDAVRHAQAAEDWRLAARLLGDHWTRLWLSGARATAHALLAAFPVAAVTGDPQLAAMAAADQLFGGSLEECERYLALAARGAASVPADRRRRFEVLLTLLRLTVASQRGDLPAVVEDAEPLLDPETPDTAHLALGYEDRALALFSLGEAELSTFRLDDAEQHLEQALALTRASDLPFLEITALGELAHLAAMRSSLTLGLRRSMEAVALAERHGWTDEPVAGLAYMVLGGVTLVQGRLEEAEVWLARAERTLRIEGQPVAAALLKVERGMLELVGGRTENALVAFRGSERLARRVLAPQILITWARSFALQTLVRMGEAERGELIVAATDERERERAEMRIALAALRLAQDDAEAATRTLLPILDGSVAGDPTTVWLLHALVLEVSARDALGDAGAAERALERALDLAERDGLLFPFMLYPARAVLERHRRCRTSHAWLVSELLSLLAGRPASLPAEPQPLRESLSESETRVLRYLPTNLSAPEIATELSVSVTTVKTHIQHIYGKLGAHRRAEAVERARSLGLLAPWSTRDRK
jgi:LuxR family maltose regulon positive regulatory protein